MNGLFDLSDVHKFCCKKYKDPKNEAGRGGGVKRFVVRRLRFSRMKTIANSLTLFSNCWQNI